MILFTHLYLSDNKNGELDLIRPLKFARISNVSCHLNPKSLNKYWEELFYTKTSFSDGEAMEILKDERNYNYYKNPVASLGKICDITVDAGAFKDALLTLG